MEQNPRIIVTGGFNIEVLDISSPIINKNNQRHKTQKHHAPTLFSFSRVVELSKLYRSCGKQYWIFEKTLDFHLKWTVPYRKPNKTENRKEKCKWITTGILISRERDNCFSLISTSTPQTSITFSKTTSKFTERLLEFRKQLMNPKHSLCRKTYQNIMGCHQQ